MDSPFYSETHGSLDVSELKRLGIHPDEVLDFSVNSNPFGPSPKVLAAIHQVDVSIYPDRHSTELCDRLARLNDVQTAQILAGNGTSELIYLIAHAYIQPEDDVLIIGPTFGEYQRAAQAKRAKVTEIRAEPPEFDPPLERIVEHIRERHPRVVFLCNPNNPTGRILPESDIQEILQASQPDSVLVLDQAYRAFPDGNFFGRLPAGPVIVLRSMTKDFGLAGLRLGYLLAEPDRVEEIRQFQPAWSVNVLSQKAGVAALQDMPYYEQTIRTLETIRSRFFKQIESITLQRMVSQTHFGLIRMELSAREVRSRLLQEKIQVRDCTSFGLPDHIRISTLLESKNRIFLDHLAQLSADTRVR